MTETAKQPAPNAYEKLGRDLATLFETFYRNTLPENSVRVTFEIVPEAQYVEDRYAPISRQLSHWAPRIQNFQCSVLHSDGPSERDGSIERLMSGCPGSRRHATGG